jgi:hypothetical protein
MGVILFLDATIEALRRRDERNAVLTWKLGQHRHAPNIQARFDLITRKIAFAQTATLGSHKASP